MQNKIGVIMDSSKKKVIAIIGMIILAEAIIMAIIHRFEYLFNIPEIILDPLLLLILIAPGVYILVYRPLDDCIQKKEIAIQRLEDSEKQLEAAVATKDQLFTIIAHDLRSPFSPLLATIGYLKENFSELTDEEVKSDINLIDQISKKIYNLVQDLLQWAQLQTNKIKLNSQKFDLNECINNVLALSEENAHEKGIKITYNKRENNFILADEDMTKTVLRNLISNAIKFTKRNGCIEVDVKEELNAFIVSVKDNGVGMDGEIVSKLFSSSINESKYGTENEKGTGLGLTLCRELVEKNHGKFFVESKLGKGSTFIFTIPKAGAV